MIKVGSIIKWRRILQKKMSLEADFYINHQFPKQTAFQSKVKQKTAQFRMSKQIPEKGQDLASISIIARSHPKHKKKTEHCAPHYFLLFHRIGPREREIICLFTDCKKKISFLRSEHTLQCFLVT